MLRTVMPREEQRLDFTQVRGASSATYFGLQCYRQCPLALLILYSDKRSRQYDYLLPSRGLLIAQLRQPDPRRNVPALEASPVDQTHLNYTKLQSWLAECDRLHTVTCKPQTGLHELSTPLQCIDCETRKVTQMGESDTYVALSYVWGGVVSNSESTTGQSTTSIPKRNSQVVEDAINLVKKLGQRYLWIDQFCIDQRDHHTKNLQIMEMNKIYAGAYVTIVAAAGADADYGLVGASRPRSHKQMKTQIGDFDVYNTMPRLGHAISRTTWNSRGWTYQEAVLSRRCIFLTEHQAYFVCQSSMRCESVTIFKLAETQQTSETMRRGSIAHAISQAEPRDSIKSPIEELTDHITEYNCRDLRFEADVLDAFRGMLARSTLYIFYGVPLAVDLSIILPQESQYDRGFAKGLCWHRHPRSQIRQRRALQRRQNFPSWSWCGWKGYVTYFSSTFNAQYGTFASSRPRASALKSPRFLLEDEESQEHSFEDIIAALQHTTIIPELSYTLIIQAEVLTFTFQLGTDNRICWCACHPDSQHPGKVPSWEDPHVGARPDFFERPALNSAMYTRILTAKWDCLFLHECESEKYKDRWIKVQDLMIVEWKGNTAYRVGNLSFCLQLWALQKYKRAWKKIRLG